MKITVNKFLVIFILIPFLFIALTRERNSELSEIADITIEVPGTNTYKVQELHLPIYHSLCMMLEKYFFRVNTLVKGIFF